MTQQQNKLVWYWATCCLFFTSAGAIFLLDIENKQVAVVILSAVFAFTVILFGFTEFMKGFQQEGETLGQFIEKYPVLRFWLIIYCLVFLPILIYKMYEADENGVSSFMYFLSFLLLVGPMAYFMERERFKSLGE